MLKSGWTALLTGLAAVFTALLNLPTWPTWAVMVFSASFCTISMFSLALRLSSYGQASKPEIGYGRQSRKPQSKFLKLYRWVVAPLLLAALAGVVQIFMALALAGRMNQFLRYRITEDLGQVTRIEFRLPNRQLNELSLFIPRSGKAAKERTLCETINFKPPSSTEDPDPTMYSLKFTNLPRLARFSLLCPWNLVSKDRRAIVASVTVTPLVDLLNLNVARWWRLGSLAYGGILWLMSVMFFQVNAKAAKAQS